VYTFLVTLHVLGAVLLTGPFILAAFVGRRAIRRRDAGGIRSAARLMAIFATGSLVVALLGVGALSLSNRYSFGTPWVIISLTLFVVAMAVATGYTVPALRRAGGMVEHGVLDKPPAPTARDDATPEPTLAATATDLAAKERLDNTAGRVAGSGALVLVLIVIITILMVIHPFGT
jgi:hypothetical protein